MVSLFLAGLFTLGIILVFAAIALSISTPSRVDMVVEQYRQPRTLEEAELAQPFTRRIVRPILLQIARIINQRTPQSLMDSTRLKLDLAGNPFDLPVLEFMGLRGLATVLGAVLLGLFAQVLNAQSWLIVLLILAGAVLGFYLPVFWLDYKIRARREDIEFALPDALDMLTICVEAGLGLDAAMSRVAEKWDNALGRAFGRVIYEIRLGKSRQEAMRDMAERGGSTELTNFVAAVIQVDKLGGGIAKLLRIQSEQMRVTRRQRAYARANQTPIKMVIPLVFCFFPSLFIILIGPAAIRILVKGF